MKIKKRNPPTCVDVWGSKSRTASTQFICRIPARQVVAFLDRNRPFYAYLEVKMGPHRAVRASNVERPIAPTRDWP